MEEKDYDVTSDYIKGAMEREDAENEKRNREKRNERTKFYIEVTLSFIGVVIAIVALFCTIF